MNYKKKTTITVPSFHWEAIGDWLIARFLEEFWTDALVNEYISSWRKQFDKLEYLKNSNWPNEEGIISVKDYQEFLDNLRKSLPKKYRKKWSAGKPWFDNVVPMVDMGIWPMTFEQGKLLLEGRKEAEKKFKNIT